MDVSSDLHRSINQLGDRVSSLALQTDATMNALDTLRDAAYSEPAWFQAASRPLMQSNELLRATLTSAKHPRQLVSMPEHAFTEVMQPLQHQAAGEPKSVGSRPDYGA